VAALAVGTNLATPVPFFVAAFFVVAFVAATHDIALDGFYLLALDEKDQARFSGLRVAVYRLAMLFGSGVLLVLAGKTSWFWAFALASAVFFILALFHQFALPTVEKKPSASSKTNQLTFKEAFLSFVRRPGMTASVAFLFLFKVGDNFLFSMAAPFLLEAGMTTAELGFYSGTLASSALILGSMAGGWIISKYGLKNNLWKIGLVQNLSLPVYIWAAAAKPAVMLLGAIHCLEYFVAGLGTAAYTNFMMRLCQTEYRASHFAVATGIMSLSLTVTGVAAGFFAQRLGWTWFFVITFAASVPGMLLLPGITRSLPRGK
jgi:PAT family beta-lactamase induction signal transducer AmpG